MIASRCLLNGFLVIALTLAVLIHNATGTSVIWSDDKGGEDGSIAGSVVSGEGTTLSPSLLDRVIVVMYSIKQQASKTLNRAGSAASVLSHLQPGTTKQTLEVGGIRLRAPKKKLPSGENTLGRLQETKGRTVAATKKVVDETIHKLQSTVSDIRRTISGEDLSDVSGDRRRSSSLDSLFRPWAWRVRRCLSRGPTGKIEIKKPESIIRDIWAETKMLMDAEKKREMEFEIWKANEERYNKMDEILRNIGLHRKKEEVPSRGNVVVEPPREEVVKPRAESVVPPMHPLDNSYNNTGNNLTIVDLFILILIGSIIIAFIAIAI
ncbi:uncharacterized protein LOC114131189 isoform X3 [Aphis gossypii]|uniref:uncharacterized protein LOC114131189 isoform X3 n=1 Tax=Aphis gossypii TaxID=80765 RepID=UPI0021598270|nr:uncharacterized protein LOC114131189 isoform X3 [Aphis gossypii]